MQIRIRLETIPWAMAAGRALLGPVMIVGARCGWNGIGLAALIMTALLSDIFDGVLARRWKCDTAAVRLFDSIADTAFYLCVGIALWLGQPQLWRHNAGLMVALLAMEALNWGFAIVKFGKPASYHSYLAKTWGLLLATAVIAALASGHHNLLIPIALVTGLATNIEGMLMSAVLPVWRRDVKTLRVAWSLRKQLQGAEPRRTAASMAVAGVLALCVLAAPAQAAQPGHAAYEGGTAGLARDTVGTMNTSPATSLNFEYRKLDGSVGTMVMLYSQITSVEPTQETAHPLGILPMIAVALVIHPPERYFLTLHYVDSENVPQIAIFSVAKRDQRVLTSVVNARTKRCAEAAAGCRPLTPGPTQYPLKH